MERLNFEHLADCLSTQDKALTSVDREGWGQRFLKAKPFVFPYEMLEGKTWEHDKIIDLPFVDTWIELSRGEFLTAPSVKEGVVYHYDIVGLLIHENSDLTHQLLQLVKVTAPEIKGSRASYFIDELSEENQALAPEKGKLSHLDGAKSVISHLFKSLRKARLFPDSDRKSVKLKTSLGKQKRRIGQVVYIGNHKQTSILNKSGKPVEYSHRFEVRGHWRQLKNSFSIGKDREGNRAVKGYTWVSAFEKGDPDLKLIRKVRVKKEQVRAV